MYDECKNLHHRMSITLSVILGVGLLCGRPQRAARAPTQSQRYAQRAAPQLACMLPAVIIHRCRHNRCHRWYRSPSTLTHSKTRPAARLGPTARVATQEVTIVERRLVRVANPCRSQQIVPRTTAWSCAGWIAALTQVFPPQRSPRRSPAPGAAFQNKLAGTLAAPTAPRSVVARHTEAPGACCW